jgi:predicted Holliday junction resolvase-like endonuclease
MNIPKMIYHHIAESNWINLFLIIPALVYAIYVMYDKNQQLKAEIDAKAKVIEFQETNINIITESIYAELEEIRSTKAVDEQERANKKLSGVIKEELW